MDYIVMDLEWNQGSRGHNYSENNLTFEIIEIGAVKLNESRKILDTYHQVIRPKVYKKLHYRIKEITQLTNEDLEKGRSFVWAVRDFLSWCGDDYRFCTWGPTDLTELQNNMKYYHMERVLDFPLYYVDLQKMFSLRYDDGHKKRTLTSAVEYLGIPENESFHRALCDAYYTARIMQEMDFDTYKDRLSIDTFYPPRVKEEEIFARFDTYTKLVTREFFSREEMFADPDVLGFYCNKCGAAMKVIIDWFSDSGKTYYGLAKCRKHGYVRGKLSIKKHDDDGIFAIKILKSTDKEGADKIRQKQSLIRKKRRERRHNMQNSIPSKKNQKRRRSKRVSEKVT